jgi:hypothetical protein
MSYVAKMLHVLIGIEIAVEAEVILIALRLDNHNNGKGDCIYNFHILFKILRMRALTPTR